MDVSHTEIFGSEVRLVKEEVFLLSKYCSMSYSTNIKVIGY